MRKAILIAFTILVISLVVLVVLVASPFIYDAIRSAKQQRLLLSRTDYPQIVNAAVAITRAMTNEQTLIRPGDPIVPRILNSLAPRYLSASSNYVRMEFHGGFDHYGYVVRRSETNASQWELSYYTEKGERALATVRE